MQKPEPTAAECGDVEKAESVSHVDHVPDSTAGREDGHGFTTSEQRDIIRRLDRRLVVTVGIMYCVSFMDRTNMSVSNIAGMGQDLNLIGNRYASLPTGRSHPKQLS